MPVKKSLAIIMVTLSFGIFAVVASCRAPDTAGRGRERFTSSAIQENCLTKECHREVASAAQVHAPVRDQPCGFCHRPIDSNHPDGPGMEFESILGRNPDFCIGCHLELEPRPAYTHTPYRMRHCRECHEVHGSPVAPLMKRDVNGICLYCHRDTAARIENCRITHGAIGEETCTDTCHDPHEAEVPAFLREEAGKLCLTCHGIPGDPSHPPESEDRCITCHYPHAGNIPGLVRDGVR